MEDIEYLRHIFKYDPETGALVRTPAFAKGRGKKLSLVGEEAGNLIKTTGMVRVWVDGKDYAKADVCWAIYYGEWPEKIVDHIDRNKENHAISNFRLVTKMENAWNQGLRAQNRTGVKGVSYRADLNRYVVQICKNYRRKYIGCYKTLEEAKEAYNAAARERFGEFAFINA